MCNFYLWRNYRANTHPNFRVYVRRSSPILLINSLQALPELDREWGGELLEIILTNMRITCRICVMCHSVEFKMDLGEFGASSPDFRPIDFLVGIWSAANNL